MSREPADRNVCATLKARVKSVCLFRCDILRHYNSRRAAAMGRRAARLPIAAALREL